MNNENKEFFNNDIETNIIEEEIILAPPTELFDEAKEIEQSTKSDEKYPFSLKYDANQKDFLKSMLQTVGAVVENDDEEDRQLFTQMNMSQLAFIKRLESVEGVQTDEGRNPFIRDEAVSSETIHETPIEALEAQTAEVTNNTHVMMPSADEQTVTSTATDEATAVAEPVAANLENGIAVACVDGASSSCCCPTNTKMESAEEIQVERFVSGCICCPCSEQWFKFTVPQTKQYTIYTSGSLDTVGTLYDCCGNYVTQVDDAGGKLNFRIVRALTAGATYYIKVRAYGYGTGSYTLRVTDLVFANYVTINKSTINLVKGVTYELPITPNYVYKGYNGAQRIPGLSVSISPANATQQKIWWYEEYGDVLNCTYGWDDDGDRYIHVTATDIGTSKLYAVDWNENGRRDECTITVSYCGGSNYRDVTQHSLVLQNDGYYVCSKCGYRIKSPGLQDKEILSDEDYYTVVSCITAIPYYSKIDYEDEGNYSIKATALRLIIDNIRSKSQYTQKYEYVGADGAYKREYTVGNENDDYYMPVSTNYNVIDNSIELALNNGIASGIVELVIGWSIPAQYQFLFFDLADGYTNLTDFLCDLAEKAGYKAISIILKLILFGSNVNQMAVTDKVVEISFSVGAGIYTSKIVYDSDGNLKSQEHSVS